MNHQFKRDIIRAKPIGDGLTAFRHALLSTCKAEGLPCSAASLSHLDTEVLKNLSLDFVTALLAVPASSVLPSVSRGKTLLGDLSKLNSTIDSDDFDFNKLIPLFVAVSNEESDEVIWDKVYATVTESTPPPKSLPLLGETPYVHTTSSFVNSSEHRKYVDTVLKEELGPIYVGIPGFYDAYFGNVDGLEETSVTVLRRCKEGQSPLFSERTGWRDWPEDAKEKEVLEWLSKLINVLREMTIGEGFTTVSHRTVLAQPSQPLQGSTADRKLDVGLVCDLDAKDRTQYHWSRVLVLGELKSNPSADTAPKTWRDLGRYAREVLTAQDTRRFALGFTLCGSIMRLWEFDRVGSIASAPFDINNNGLQFVSTILGFLKMTGEQLGYDPSIICIDGKKYVDIQRDGQTERLVIDGLMKRAPCVAGRATTCWKAYCEGDQSRAPLVIKDSWQYPEREEEGKLLREAAENDVVNVARYYYHETVQIQGRLDDISGGVRKGLDVTRSTNYRLTRPDVSEKTSDTTGVARSRSRRSARLKRSSSCTDAALPTSKRTCSTSSTKGGVNPAVQNRIHRRVIVRDFGKPIYKAQSRTSMLSALQTCIEGYESLRTRAGYLQGDISTGNLIIRDQENHSVWSAFLIDLDLAIKEQREKPSGAKGKIGTRAFMAIGLLLGERHSFMHDLESFFWVLFWICIHYNGPGDEGRVIPRFDKWNYADMEELAEMKKGIVAHEDDFLKLAGENFGEYYQPLKAWVNRLRKVVFPNGGRWEKENQLLASQMKDVLQAAVEDEKSRLTDTI